MIESCEQIKALVTCLKESVGSGGASYTVSGEWDGASSASKGRIVVSCEFWCVKWMDLLRDLFPYVTIIIIASIVGCRFGGCTNIEHRDKVDSKVQVHNIEASASVHVNREIDK